MPATLRQERQVQPKTLQPFDGLESTGRHGQVNEYIGWGFVILGVLRRDVIDGSDSRSGQEDSTGVTLAAEACARQGLALSSTYKGGQQAPDKNAIRHTVLRHSSAAVQKWYLRNRSQECLVQQAPQLLWLPPQSLGHFKRIEPALLQRKRT